jgi:sterol desaturase/sphingolipid hydroxylase (fatty acid hydroxylase superfamily)
MDLIYPVILAIPFFLVAICAEVLWTRYRGGATYELRDSLASMTMGTGNFFVGFLTVYPFMYALYWFHQFRLFDLGFDWWIFVFIFFAQDFAFYWLHRLSHEHRFWWAAHVNHHSSQRFNLSTALRQSWTDFLCMVWIIWIPLAIIGFPPQLILFQIGANLVYQFWIHTELVDALWRPIEYVFNTPSHHRVHHAINPRYLDRNHGGTLIVWDRIFGTFVAENKSEDPCQYGIVKQIGTFNPLRIAFHEWSNIFHDLEKPVPLKEKLQYLFGPPGWSHDGATKTSGQIRAEFKSEVQAKT